MNIAAIAGKESMFIHRDFGESEALINIVGFPTTNVPTGFSKVVGDSIFAFDGYSDYSTVGGTSKRVRRLRVIEPPPGVFIRQRIGENKSEN
jgi:hypothetical protein